MLLLKHLIGRGYGFKNAGHIPSNISRSYFSNLLQKFMTNYYWPAYIFIPAHKAILKWILCSSLVFLNRIVKEFDISRGTRLPAHQHSNHVWFSHKATVPVECCFEFWCPTVLHRGLTMDRKRDKVSFFVFWKCTRDKLSIFLFSLKNLC